MDLEQHKSSRDYYANKCGNKLLDMAKVHPAAIIKLFTSLMKLTPLRNPNNNNNNVYRKSHHKYKGYGGNRINVATVKIKAKL